MVRYITKELLSNVTYIILWQNKCSRFIDALRVISTLGRMRCTVGVSQDGSRMFLRWFSRWFSIVPRRCPSRPGSQDGIQTTWDIIMKPHETITYSYRTTITLQQRSVDHFMVQGMRKILMTMTFWAVRLPPANAPMAKVCQGMTKMYDWTFKLNAVPRCLLSNLRRSLVH